MSGPASASPHSVIPSEVEGLAPPWTPSRDSHGGAIIQRP